MPWTSSPVVAGGRHRWAGKTPSTVSVPCLGCLSAPGPAKHLAGLFSVLGSLVAVGLSALRLTVGAEGPDDTAGQAGVKQRGFVRQERRDACGPCSSTLWTSSGPHGFSGHHEEWCFFVFFFFYLLSPFSSDSIFFFFYYS